MAAVYFACAAPAQTQSDTVVRLATTPRYAGVATVVEEVSIGAESGPLEYLFTRVTRVLPLRDGTVLVLDRGSSMGRGSGGGSAFIRQYDVNGSYLRDFGRYGRGPGEFVQPSGLAQLPDGRVLLLDTGLGRINVYSERGQSLEFWPFERAAGIVTEFEMPPLIADTAGFVYRLAASRRLTDPLASPFAPPTYVRMRSDGSVVDTIPIPVFPPGSVLDADLFSASPRPGSTFRHALPNWPHPLWRISPHGYMITGVPSRYAVDLRLPRATAAVYGPAVLRATGVPAPAHWTVGDPIISIRRNVAPVPISNAARTQARERITAGLREVDPNWVWRGPEVPRVAPAYSMLVPGLDGRIWVGVLQPSQPAPPAVFDVFEPNGSYVGQVRSPGGSFHLFGAVRGDHIWGVTQNADGVQFVKRWRVVWR